MLVRCNGLFLWLKRRFGAGISARPTVVYSSDLKRAAETAEIIERACDVSNLVLTEALRERHMGYLQGVFKGFANFEVKNGLDFDGRNQELPFNLI
uniref:Uncharacterized protein n=1 Tax=Oryza glumipatula TaxID=40148 RepID=A0A0D9YRE3_9ORYZ